MASCLEAVFWRGAEVVFQWWRTTVVACGHSGNGADAGGGGGGDDIGPNDGTAPLSLPPSPFSQLTYYF